MTENAINLIRSYTSSWWKWLWVCLRSRALVVELLGAYEKAEAKANSASNDQFSIRVQKEILQHELDDLRAAHSKDKQGVEVLKEFIKRNHTPTRTQPAPKK